MWSYGPSKSLVVWRRKIVGKEGAQVLMFGEQVACIRFDDQRDGVDETKGSYQY
jgi:hypothetical protein